MCGCGGEGVGGGGGGELCVGLGGWRWGEGVWVATCMWVSAFISVIFRYRLLVWW